MNILDLKLTQLAKEVKTKVPCINFGGCCVFAALVSKHLSTIVPTRLVVFKGWFCDDNEASDLSEAKAKISNNTVREWNNQGIHFGHVVIEYDNDGQTYRLDSDGVEPCPTVVEDNKLTGFLSIDDAEDLAADDDGWNPSFSRSNIPQMKQIIDNFFQQLSLDLQSV
jgi:hypothetical protein